MDIGLLGQSKWILGKMKGPLGDKMGGMIVGDSVSLGVVSTSILFSCDESQSSQLMTLLGRRLMTFFGGVCLHKGRSQEACSHICCLRCLQPQIINIPIWPSLGWHVLNPYRHILEWHILLPSSFSAVRL